MGLTVVLVMVITILLLWFLWWRIQFNYWQRRNIPNVRGFFSGCLKDMVTFKTNFGIHLKTLYLDPKFQNTAVMGLYAPHRPALLIRDPDLLKSIFIRDFAHFRNRFARTDPHADVIGEKGLFFSRHGFWKEMRPKLSPAFSGVKLKHIYPLIQVVGEKLEKHLLEKVSGATIEMKHLTNQYTIDAINTTLLGIESNVLEKPNDQFATEANRVSFFDSKRNFHWFLMFFMPQLGELLSAKVFSRQTEDFLRTSTTLSMAEREQSGVKRNDLIDIFVKLKQAATANGEDMTDFMNGVIGTVGSLMFAGYDTSATTLCNLLFELATNPDIQKRLREEITHAFHAGKGDISYEALNELKYLSMVLDETLRMHPVALFLERQHNRADDGALYSLKPYFDYTLPVDMAIYISVFGLHHDPKYWPNPDVFDPERFTAENIKSRHPMVYLPFGSGPHICIGARLGILQMKSGLAYFLKNHYVQLCQQTNLNPQLDAHAFLPKTKGGVYLQIVRDNMGDMQF